MWDMYVCEGGFCVGEHVCLRVEMTSLQQQVEKPYGRIWKQLLCMEFLTYVEDVEKLNLCRSAKSSSFATVNDVYHLPLRV